MVQGDFVTLEIEDNGIGLTEEQAALVFERFYRVDGTGVDGSGLRLAIVREIAELHHADASLRPNPVERGPSRGWSSPGTSPMSRIPPSMPRSKANWVSATADRLRLTARGQPL